MTSSTLSSPLSAHRSSPSSEPRTRFAPSPTGYLHIGGARTALFNWLFARHNNGRFILRIEDTDVARSTEESIKAILEGMEWLGLSWDEGPYYQSRRFSIHRENASMLLKEGNAYRCYCTAEELEERRNEALRKGMPPRYDRRCREFREGGAPKGPSVIRFKVPEGKVIVNDRIKGKIIFENSEIEDFIILRSDNTPTYNLSVVVDDATMQITHVIRGDDHLNNTPKQILIYNALGLPVPEFAHLPMILGSDKTRLSKRHGATSVMAYKQMGYLPHAIVNYLARLGWSHGDQEIFTIDELIERFSLDNVGKSSGTFNPEKLLWLNAHYIKEMQDVELSQLLIPFLEEKGYTVADDKRLPKIAGTLKKRAKTMVEMAEGAEFYFKEDIAYDKKAAAKYLTPDKIEIFNRLIIELERLHDFEYEDIEGVFNRIMDESAMKLGKIAQPVRVAITGGTVSPGIFETLEALGKRETIERLKRAANYIKS